jgi:hypothetical protein
VAEEQPGVTARKPPDPAGEWLTVDQAANHLGLSPSGFRALASDESLEVRRRGSRPGVRRVDLDTYLARARIRPGDISTGGSLDPKPRYEPAEPDVPHVNPDAPGVAEATFLRDQLGWTDADIAEALGLHYSNVYRRRLKGFRAEQIQRLRRLIEDSVRS